MLSKHQKGSLTGSNRPKVSAAFFVSFILLFLTCHHLPAQGGMVDADTYIQKAQTGSSARVVEYELKYDIGFWIFQRVGIATATLKKMDTPATYILTLEVSAAGIFAKLCKRQMIYQTVMEFDRESNRMKPLSSSQKKINGEKTREKTITFDHENGTCNFAYRKNGTLEKERTVPNPPGLLTPEDANTAFYNLCNGVYGEIQEGTTYSVNIIVKERPSNLTLEVCSQDGKKEFAHREDIEEDLGFVAKISVDPEVVDSKRGEIFVCFSTDSTPCAIEVKDVIGFGNLYGHLVDKVIYQ